MRVALFWGFYAAHNGGFLGTFRNNLSVPSSGVKQYLIFENGTNRLLQNVEKKLSFYTA